MTQMKIIRRKNTGFKIRTSTEEWPQLENYTSRKKRGIANFVGSAYNLLMDDTDANNIYSR